jgi:hypothetical protein
MQKLKIDLENCYGIKKLNVEFNFTKCQVAAVYAPNGAMKGSRHESDHIVRLVRT